MPVTQMIMASLTTTGSGSGPVGGYAWDSQPSISYFRPAGGNDPALVPTLMPDNTTTLDLHVFSGTNYITTAGHTNVTTFWFNIWIYPAYGNVGILTELGSTFENTGYFYNMLEIDMFNNIRAGVWNGGNISNVTGSAVNLNAWNHLYFYYDGTTMGISVNGGTATTTTTARGAPTDSYFAFGSQCNTYIASNSRFNGKLGTFVANTSSTTSSYLSTKSIYGL